MMEIQKGDIIGLWWIEGRFKVIGIDGDDYTLSGVYPKSLVSAVLIVPFKDIDKNTIQRRHYE